MTGSKITTLRGVDRLIKIVLNADGALLATLSDDSAKRRGPGMMWNTREASAGIAIWDIAAGSLIAAEAGAQVTGLHGRPADSSMTVAAAPPLLAELRDLLASTDPERDA